MISHEYKCIFLHIPRTGGTSIEAWLCGDSWYNIERETQHLLASQAKELYADYWDDYFKFSFVRDPVDRVLSCLAYPAEFGILRSGETLHFGGYHSRFSAGPGFVLEHDYRFRPHPDPEGKSGRYRHNTVYGNMLDAEIDFIGRNEEMVEHTAEIRKILGVPEPFDDTYRYEVSVVRQDRNLSEATLNRIYSMYRRDYERFCYVI